MFKDIDNNIPFSDKYEFYKSESLVGVGILILTIIFTFIFYDKEIHLFLYCLSWYILFSEVYMIYGMYRNKRK